MEFFVEFYHSVSEIPYRCRKPRFVEKKGQATITVEHKNIAESKVAFVVKDYNKEIVIRTWDKKTLYRVAVVRASDGEHNMSISELHKIISAFGRGFFGTKGYDEIVKSLQESADKYIVVGDMVYEKVSEPRYCIYTFGLGHNHGGTSFSVDYHYNENISADRYFNALQYKEAKQRATEIALGRGDTDSVKHFNNVYYIDVLEKDCVRCNPVIEHGNGNAIHNEFERIIQNSSSIEDATVGVLARAMI